MKKLLTIAGLAGIVISAALAQGGTRSQSAGIGVTVDTYMNLTPIVSSIPLQKTGDPIFSYHVTDGGFAGPYTSLRYGKFNATSNVIYKLDAVATIGNGYLVQVNLDGTAYGATSEVTGQPVTPLAPHTVSAQLMGNATLGLPPDAGTSGTLTVTIASA